MKESSSLKDTNIFNGVVEIDSGLLLRCGYCDFTTDGSFDPTKEIQVENPTIPTYLKNDPIYPDSPEISHWTGKEWDYVPRI